MVGIQCRNRMGLGQDGGEGWEDISIVSGMGMGAYRGSGGGWRERYDWMIEILNIQSECPR